jgi:vancomycin aglycone glucosyltransferase
LERIADRGLVASPAHRFRIALHEYGGSANAGIAVVPQVYDQFYFARRVEELGIGSSHREGGSLRAALARALEPEVRATARTVARAVRTDGAAAAARRLAQITTPQREQLG